MEIWSDNLHQVFHYDIKPLSPNLRSSIEDDSKKARADVEVKSENENRGWGSCPYFHEEELRPTLPQLLS